MVVKLYVIATRGKGGQEIYLKCSDDGSNRMEWTTNIDDSYAVEYRHAKDFAENYFKHFNKWYLTEYMVVV